MPHTVMISGEVSIVDEDGNVVESLTFEDQELMTVDDNVSFSFASSDSDTA